MKTASQQISEPANSKALGCLARGSLFAAVACVLFLVHPAICAAQNKAPTRSEPKPSWKYDTPGTQLKGMLIECKVYGPPGYGETPARDLRTSILILKLSQPVTVEPVSPTATNNPNGDTFKHVLKVKFFVSRSQAASARALVGRMVTATGTLNESITASQYTNVWLDVSALKPN
jgi:hypothetical protein